MIDFQSKYLLLLSSGGLSNSSGALFAFFLFVFIRVATDGMQPKCIQHDIFDTVPDCTNWVLNKFIQCKNMFVNLDSTISWKVNSFEF